MHIIAKMLKGILCEIVKGFSAFVAPSFHCQLTLTCHKFYSQTKVVVTEFHQNFTCRLITENTLLLLFNLLLPRYLVNNSIWAALHILNTHKFRVYMYVV